MAMNSIEHNWPCSLGGEDDITPSPIDQNNSRLSWTSAWAADHINVVASQISKETFVLPGWYLVEETQLVGGNL